MDASIPILLVEACHHGQTTRPSGQRVLATPVDATNITSEMSTNYSPLRWTRLFQFFWWKRVIMDKLLAPSIPSLSGGSGSSLTILQGAALD